MRIEINDYSIVLSNISCKQAWIMLSGSETPTSPKYRVRLNFNALPETATYSLQQEGDLVVVSMNFAVLEPTIDILRNERPVFFDWSTTSKRGLLSTGDEPVGDGEL